MVVGLGGSRSLLCQVNTASIGLAGGWSVVKTHIPEFLKSEKLTSADLEGTSNISRESMRRYRDGADLRLSTALRILRGARRATGRRVQLSELWDLDPDDL